jgi:hypothetical protein
MWSWSQESFTSEAARKGMLEFCSNEGIVHIDQHVSIRDGKIRNADALAALAALAAGAAEQKITVNALRGDKTMFFAANHERTLSDLKTIVEFNNALPENARLAGIKFDVEPYLTPEWKAGGQQRARVINDYLAFLKKAKDALKHSGLELCVDVPFWWDKPVYDIEFNGETKRFVHHIQDLTDWIGIMSYRRDSAEVLKLIRSERAYASETKRLRCVAPGLETGRISGKEAWISFGGVPPATFRNELSALRDALSGDRAIRCIMLHHYGSLAAYLKQPDRGTDP